MRDRTRALAASSAALLLSVLVWFNYSAVLPDLVVAWGLSGFRAGAVFAAFQAGYLLAIVPAGALADRRSPRHVIAVGGTGAGLASVGFALLASGFLSGALLRFLSGVFMAGVYVPGMRFLSDWYPESDRGRAMGIYVGTYSFAVGLSFLAASAVAARLGWRAAVLATSLPAALLVAPLALGAAGDAPDAGHRTEKGVGDGDSGGDDESTTAKSGTVFGVDVRVLRNPAYLAAVGAYAFHCWELFGVRAFVVDFLAGVRAVAATPNAGALAGTLAGVAMVVGGAGNLVGGALSDRLGRGPAIALALCVSGTVSLTIAGLSALSLPALTALLVVYGLAITADSAPVSTAITEVVADDRVGTALSLQSFAGFGASVVSPLVFGFALDRGGFGLAFPTLAVGAALGVVCALALTRLQGRHGVGG